MISQNKHKHTNALINETSPYLLQHAHNPVDWHPWNEETLAKAKKEDKLLLISIGYAACHWCHVMEHESFEDEGVAQIMNENFIPVKVDREERPDVDDIYMTACNLVSGRGGWPLNAFAMPDGRPIWAGTYFPKDKWIDVLNQFIKLKNNNPSKLEDSAQRLTSGINSAGEMALVNIPEQFSSDGFIKAIEMMNGQIDQHKGGRDGAPKFPMPNNYELLLKYSHHFGDDNSLKSALLTLDQMSYGGIYDQVGGGFARYSVDADWKVPHFEKMLYDNSQLVGLYSMAYRLTKDNLYKHIVGQTLEFIDREMTSSEGGCYSSLDADSEGVEGKFYVWTEDELASILGDETLLATAKKYYSTTVRGNWEHSNILHITEPPKDIAQNLDITFTELNKRVALINKKLLKERGNRIRPGLDDKILTGWNALMISGYTEAYKAFQNEKYLQKALTIAEFIVKNQMSDDFRLNRNYKEGKSNINAFLDDYVSMIKAALDLYEITFNNKWIDLAKGLTDYTLLHFSNEENGMFFRASDIDPPLVSKSIETSDNVIPATNSIMARNLFRIGEMTYNEKYIQRSKQMFANMYENIKASRQPSFYSNWLQLWLDYSHAPYEIIISGKDLKKKAQELHQNYLGNAIVMGSILEEDQLPLLKYKYVDGKTLIYVCENKVCQLPVENVNDAIAVMESKTH
ncbi:MAG: thioredoxin domain-containing protein [Saprospiraceae bacterium]